MKTNGQERGTKEIKYLYSLHTIILPEQKELM